MTPKRLIFIRHAETTDNLKGIVSKKKDSSVILTNLGKTQAEKLAEYCKNEGVTGLYSSPEIRAIDTAKAIGNQLGIENIVVEELGERDWGEWSGMSWNEINAMISGKSFEDRYRFIPPQGESWKQMEDRLKKAVRAISKQEGEVLAIITHNGALRALLPILKNAPRESSFKYDFANASVTIFDYSEGEYREIVVNDTSYLD